MDKALGLLGIAAKAGRVSGGSELCEEAIRKGMSSLVLIAEDISQNGRKAISDCCNYYGVQYITYSTMAQLGKAIGRQQRAVVSINDAGLAAAISKRIAEVSEERKG